MKPSASSKIGDVVTVTDPKTGKQAKGVVHWVSATRSTVMVQLDSGYAYAFPQEEGRSLGKE